MSKSREFWLVDDNEIDRVVNGRLVEAAFGGSVRKFKDGPTFLEALAADAGVEEDDLRSGSALEAGGHRIPLYFIVFHCILWYSIIPLYSIVFQCIPLYCIPLYSIVLHCIPVHCIPLYSMAFHCMSLK